MGKFDSEPSKPLERWSDIDLECGLEYWEAVLWYDDVPSEQAQEFWKNFGNLVIEQARRNEATHTTIEPDRGDRQP